MDCKYFVVDATEFVNKHINIYINPTDEDILAIKKLYNYDVRGMIYPYGKRIYLWDADLRHKYINDVMEKSRPHYINIHEGLRFHLDDSFNGWGWDFDFGQRFEMKEAKKYIKQFERYLYRFGDLKNLPIYFWGIDKLGKGPFEVTFYELFN